MMRAIRVFVIGDAVQPGSYEMSSVASVLTSIYAAGGPNTQGSLRTIRVERDGQTVATLDLYRYLQAGDRQGEQPPPRVWRCGEAVDEPEEPVLDLMDPIQNRAQGSSPAQPWRPMSGTKHAP